MSVPGLGGRRPRGSAFPYHPGTTRQNKFRKMTISYNWLKNHIELDLSAEELAPVLTSIGLEVESLEKYESVPGGLQGLLIGQVLTCAPVPDSERLTATTVDVGGERPLSIVCGAPNVAPGQKVVVAPVGATIHPLEGEPLKMKKAKIRGLESEGMICAEDEVGLGTDHEGIMVLDPAAPVGSPAARYFELEEDWVFEIGLTPNRVDAASHLGVARDLAAYFRENPQARAKRPSVEAFAADDHALPIEVVVENPQACPRYSGVSLTGLHVGPSPEWLQTRLKAIGLKPINNVVDVTNFVLHELGHPLHAFDADKIGGRRVVVRGLAQDTEFTTLDGQVRKMHAQDLMICDDSQGMCVAGVFGGLDSGVSAQTTSVFLESAYFNPVWVRKTAKRHGLSTDSSFRFERGADPSITVYALKRAALLIKEVAGGRISSDIVDVYPQPIANCQIRANYRNIDRLIGKSLPPETIHGILAALEIELLEKDEQGFLASVPTYRVDVRAEADLIEEILRIYGYNNVEIPEAVNSTLSYAPKPDPQKWKNRVADMLAAQGFNEAMNNSLTKASYYEQHPDFDAQKTVRIVNPLSSDLDAMRQGLLFSALENVAHNLNRKAPEIKLFEFGNCYLTQPSSPDGIAARLAGFHERVHLSITLCGQDGPASWRQKAQPASYYDLKGAALRVLVAMGYRLEDFQIGEVSDNTFSYGLEYRLNGKTFLRLGALRKSLLKSFDIEEEVFFAEFVWDYLLLNLANAVKFAEMPKYPEVKRDLALLLEEGTPYQKVLEVATKAEKQLLRRVELFDVYKGKGIPEGKKSYAVSFYLRDDEKTLNDKQIEKAMGKIFGSLKHHLAAELR